MRDLIFKAFKEKAFCEEDYVYGVSYNPLSTLKSPVSKLIGSHKNGLEFYDNLLENKSCEYKWFVFFYLLQ